MTSRKFIILWLTTIIISCSQPPKKTEDHIDKKPNILFIISDDLNDWLGYMGHPQIKTPNIDKLAARGTYFTNAQCSAPLCSPSRASFMTGLYPFNNGVYTNSQAFNKNKNIVTIPSYFKEQGYYVAGAGKLFHSGGDYVKSLLDEVGPGIGLSGGPFVDGELNSNLQNPTHTVDRGPGKLKAVLPLNGMPNDRPYNRYNTFDWGAVDVTDDEMPDGKIANWTVAELKKKHKKPFFIATGFIRPHQPLFAPRKYHEMYPPEDVTLPNLLKNDLEDLSQTGKDFALLPATSGTHKTVVKYGQWKNAISSYMACVSFVDAQVGKIIDALDNSEYAENTMIVFFSDHGWHLGEKQHWGKLTGWQTANRVPLLIIPPKNMKPEGFKEGSKYEGMVSLVDLFPTLAELSQSKIPLGLDGKSLVSVLKNHTIEKNRTVISTFGMGNNVIMTRKWRYLHYFDGTEELYDLETDPNEFDNLAEKPEFSEIKKTLSKHLPRYSDIAHFVRMDNWKAIFYNGDKPTELYDIKGKQGLMEKFNMVNERPKILAQIKAYLTKHKITKKYVTI